MFIQIAAVFEYDDFSQQILYIQADMNLELFKDLGRVYEYYYRARYLVFIKASGFPVPWFSGRKARQALFLEQFSPLSLAAFNEGLRNNTSRVYGEPDEQLLDAFCRKYLTDASKPLYKMYWSLICSEIAKNPENTNQMVSGLTTLFLDKLFGPEGVDPDPAKLSARSTHIAVDFQLGTLMFKYYSDIKKVLARYEAKNSH